MKKDKDRSVLVYLLQLRSIQRDRLATALDRVLGLREHEKEIPIDAYLAELERIRVGLGLS
jgi:hypothetical protein